MQRRNDIAVLRNPRNEDARKPGERDPNGRTRITVNDCDRPGFTVTANRADSAIIADFIKEGS